ncbi:YafY family protein [Ruminococcus flavefaciens]|uniref:helix-turn-helix transcriptional regulator n=1 Tax=Ruminococcus flavefaciens TaxID=1265 RepID=UPI0026F1D90B|nr:transcriptional regulator [Ruminococcus flavefaciens]
MATPNLPMNEDKATVESNSDFKGNTKLKLLRLLEILQSESTQQKPLSTAQICQRLEKIGMHCERRTLYRDIKLLIDCGYDIEIVTERNSNLYYYKKATELSFSELKILIDAAKAASFITQEQTEDLVRKLVTLGGSRKKELLSSNMVFFNSHKHSNTDIYDAVSTIEAAIRNRIRISFFYFDLDEHAERVYRHNKKEYLVDPIVLIFNNDNYYLHGYTPEHDEIRNYRVDRMADVKVTTLPMNAKADVSPAEIEEYISQSFKMYGGETVEALLEFKDQLLDVIFDKFGEDTPIVRKNKDSCIATVVLQESPTFWGWYFQFPDKMKICSPDWLVEKCEKWRELRYEG